MKKLLRMHNRVASRLFNIPSTLASYLAAIFILFALGVAGCIFLFRLAENEAVTGTRILYYVMSASTGIYALFQLYHFITECHYQLKWTRTMRKTAARNERTNALYSERIDTTFRDGLYFSGDGTSEKNQTIRILNRRRFPVLTESIGCTAREIAEMDEASFRKLKSRLKLKNS